MIFSQKCIDIIGLGDVFMRLMLKFGKHRTTLVFDFKQARIGIR